MARPVWSGSVTFGLVSLSVSMTAATSSHTIRFHQLERGTSDRVRNKRVNERTGKEVPYDRIVKGYPYGDEYVIVEPEELDEIAPGRSQEIEISGFVELEEIDPVFFDSTYFLQPRKKSDGKVYGLLKEALEETGRAGIATMSMHQKDYLVAVHAEGGVLVLHTLHWADEVRDPRETLDNLPEDSGARPQERKMARQLIETMAAEFDPEEYRDRTQDRVRELVEAKRKGETVERSEPAPEPTNVVDLMSALRESVERGGRGGRRKSAGGGRGKSAAGGRGRTQGAQQSEKAGRGKQAGQGKQSGRGKRAAEDLGELTKGELYDRATEAGVPGRSKMTRDELEKALSQGGGKAA